MKKTRYQTDKAIYDADIKRMISLVKEDVPIILLWHPALDTGMRKDIIDYSYTFHRQLDFRTFKRQ